MNLRTVLALACTVRLYIKKQKKETKQVDSINQRRDSIQKVFLF